MPPPYGQLLHVETLQVKGQRYRLAVFRADGGIAGKWSCEACHPSQEQEDCAAYASVEGCVDALKKAIGEHHQSGHA